MPSEPVATPKVSAVRASREILYEDRAAVLLLSNIKSEFASIHAGFAHVAESMLGL
jgi:hypothetical protein